MPLSAIVSRASARRFALGFGLGLAGAGGLLLPPLSAPALAQSGGGSSGGGASSSGGAAGGSAGGGVGGGPATGSPASGGLGSPTNGTVAPPTGIGGQTGVISNVPGGPAPRSPETTVPSAAAGALPNAPATGAATLPNGADEMSTTGSLRPGDTTGGVGGSRNEGAARAGQAPACAEVMAHRDYFTANVIAGCERQAQGGNATGAPDMGRAGNSMEGGVKPLDKPSEVQTRKAPSDAKALGSICSNC